MGPEVKRENNFYQANTSEILEFLYVLANVTTIHL